MRRLLSMAGFGLATVVASGANAAPQTFDVTFTANSFTSAFGQPAPTDPVTGSFRISLDSTQTYTDDTADIALTSLNISLGSALSFDYSPTGNANGLADELVVGGVFDGASSVQYNPPTDDFWLHIYTFTVTPTFQQLGYSTTALSGENLFYTSGTLGEDGSVTVTPVTSPVPESSTWAMLIAGFTGVGGLAYLRRRTIETATV